MEEEAEEEEEGDDESGETDEGDEGLCEDNTGVGAPNSLCGSEMEEPGQEGSEEGSSSDAEEDDERGDAFTQSKFEEAVHTA